MDISPDLVETFVKNSAFMSRVTSLARRLTLVQFTFPVLCLCFMCAGQGNEKQCVSLGLWLPLGRVKNLTTFTPLAPWLIWMGEIIR